MSEPCDEFDGLGIEVAMLVGQCLVPDVFGSPMSPRIREESG